MAEHDLRRGNKMTAREWTGDYINRCIHYVHADHDKRIHEQVKASLDLWEVVRIRCIHARIYVEVRERGEEK